MKVFAFVILAVVVVAESVYSKPSYPSASAPAYPKPEHPPMPYNFEWAVKDEPSYNDYAHQQASDDKGHVTGSYRVVLPDGRTQIVTFKADDSAGYVADVKYEGEAKYPESKPSYPSPSYPAKH